MKKDVGIYKKIFELNIQHKRVEALDIVNFELSKNSNNLDLLFWKAFLLFHLVSFPNENYPKRDKNKMVKESINIYEEIIPKLGGKEKENAEIHYTQTLAFLKDPRSLKMSLHRYNDNPTSLTLNRLMSNLCMLDMDEECLKYSKEYESLLEEEGASDVSKNTELGYHWENFDKDMADKYFKKLISSKPNNSTEEAQKNMTIKWISENKKHLLN